MAGLDEKEVVLAFMSNGCKPEDLLKAGYDVKRLRKLGISARQLISNGWGVRGLPQSGVFSDDDLLKGGCGALQFERSLQLFLAGSPPMQLQAAGLSVEDMLSLGLGADELEAAGLCDKQATIKAALLGGDEITVEVDTTQKISDLLLDIAVAAISQEVMALDSGLIIMQAVLHDVLHPGATMADSGLVDGTTVTIIVPPCRRSDGAVCLCVGELRDGGCSARQLWKAGADLAELVKAGFYAAELVEAGFSAPQLRQICKLSTLKLEGCSATQLCEAGFDLAELLDAGFCAAELKEAGFTVPQFLRAIERFTIRCTWNGRVRVFPCNREDLPRSAKDFKNLGYGADELKAAKFSCKDLKHAGFTKDQLTRAGFASADVRPLFGKAKK